MMRVSRFARIFLLASLVVAGVAPVHAQEGDSKDKAKDGAQSSGGQVLSREERIRQHEERVKQIIEERRKARLAEEQKRSGAAAPAEGQPATAPTAVGGGTPPAGGAPPPGAEAPPPDDEPVSNRVGTVVLYSVFRSEGSTRKESYTTVRKGDRFVSEIRLRNENGTRFDRVRIALKYDKRFLKPLKIFDDELRGTAEGDPVFDRIDRDSILVYDVRLKVPKVSRDMAVLKIVWEAILPTEHTPLDFRFADGDPDASPHTAIYFEDKNILGRPDDPYDGVTGGSVLVLKPMTDEKARNPEILQGKKEELKKLYLGSLGTQAPAGIRLLGPEVPPAVGEEFDVFVALENPNGAIIDAVRFFLKFDPAVFQAIDQDRGNWVKTGTNVHDGPYRGDYPFDFHKNNEVDNSRGNIFYSMALGDGLALPSGTFARIRFKAVAPAATTNLELISGRQGAADLTAVNYFGFKLLSSDPKLTTPTWSSPVLPEGAEKPASAKTSASPGSNSLSSVSSPENLPAVLSSDAFLNGKAATLPE